MTRNALKTLVFTFASHYSGMMKPLIKVLCIGWIKVLEKNYNLFQETKINININFGGQYIIVLRDTLFSNGKYIEKFLISKSVS